MKKDQVIKEAGNLIASDRQGEYGNPEDNFTRIAGGWNIIVKNAMRTHAQITPAHVALMMDWLKSSRLLHDIESVDSWIDKCGYSALGGEPATTPNTSYGVPIPPRATSPVGNVVRRETGDGSVTV